MLERARERAREGERGREMESERARQRERERERASERERERERTHLGAAFLRRVPPLVVLGEHQRALLPYRDAQRRSQLVQHAAEREFFIDNLLARIH